MGRFEVKPAELQGAAGTLLAVEAELASSPAAVGDLGSAELEGALSALYGRVDALALAMGQVVGAASHNLAAAASAYAEVDRNAMPSGRGR